MRRAHLWRSVAGSEVDQGRGVYRGKVSELGCHGCHEHDCWLVSIDSERKVTSHVRACNPVKADINDDQLSFGPAFEQRRVSQKRQQSIFGKAWCYEY